MMTRFKGREKVKSWGQAIAKRSCHRRACVVVARKLAEIMHALWSDGTFYFGDPAACAADTAQRAHGKGPQASGSASMSGATTIQTHGARGLTDGNSDKQVRSGG